MDPKNTENFVDKDHADYWGQVDLYIGGSEHATGHLLYSRFWNMSVSYTHLDVYKRQDDSNGTCSVVLEVDFTYTFNPENGQFTLTTNGNTMEGEVTDLTNSNMVVYYVDKSNPTVTTKVEISATKVGK